MFKKVLAALTVAASMMFSMAPAKAVPVDVELQLLVDVSGSVSGSEYALQMNGYKNAFLNSGVQSAILGGTLGKIAVQVIQWSSSSQQNVSIDWLMLDSLAAITTFANDIGNLIRAFGGGTSPSYAIDFGVQEFVDNGFEGSRLVMDVSGDGTGNSTRTRASSDAAIAAGIDAVNGITIGGGSSLQNWYKDYVVAGTNGFHIHAADFEDFEAAVTTKLTREIGGGTVPEPGALGLLGLGLLGAALMRRKRQLV